MKKPRLPLLTVAQAAEQWNVSEKYIRKQIAEGTLPFIPLPSVGKSGRPLIRIRQEDLDAVATPFHFPAE